MKKRFVLILCFQSVLSLCLSSNAKAQVFNGDLTITTQAQIDAFNYTSITGFLNLDLPDFITNIDGLSELTSIGEHLEISNTRLINVDGLSNLTDLGGSLLIRGNGALANLNGLSNLTSLNGAMLLQNNPSLVNIDGLSNLTGLVGGIDINRCPLTNLDALMNITDIETLGFLNLENNELLTNIDGLANISGGVGQIKIVNNRLLPNIDGLLNFTSVGVGFGGGALIENNPLLTNIDGLSSLEVVAGDFDIVGNSALTNINGLSSLEEVGRRFDIRANHLTNVDGLINLEEVGLSFFIQENSALISLDGLSGLTSIGGDLRIISNFALPDLNGLSNLNHVGFNLTIRSNRSLIDFCGLYNLFNSGTIGGTIGIGMNGANTVAITTPLDLIVNADPDVCSATILDAAIGTAIPVGCLVPFLVEHSAFPEGNIFPVGTTQISWGVMDWAGNIATGTQLVTVMDNQNPVITSCPVDITVNCASDVPAIDINLVTATDNCSAEVTHVSDIISNQTCANRFTLTRTYMATDPAGNTATCSQVITVHDNIPPEISGLGVSQTALWPPNHKMQDITLNYSASDNCVNNPIVTVTVSSNEPVNGTGDGDTNPDWEIIDDHHVRLRAERAANGDGRIYKIKITVDDGCNPPVSDSTEVMVAHNITGPQSGHPFRVGSTVSFSGVFQDKPGNRHTAKWLVDNSAVANGTLTEPSGNQNGKVTGSYKFNTPGVYKLQMNVTDQNGITSYANTNGDLDAIVVIYDPNGGFTYGGGWYPSPAGALKGNPSATGKASYGFTVNYAKNATKPKGETQFEFKLGTFEYNALTFDYLVISGAKAQFKGTGKIIGGQSGVGFIMTVTDGNLDGSGIDKVRMKIFNKNNGTVIYDNQPGASDAANPIAAVGANSVIVIQGNGGIAPTTRTSEEAIHEITLVDGLEVNVHPNPSRTNFTIVVKSNNAKEKIIMQVFDQYGRSIEVRNNIISGSAIGFGDLYRPGSYYVRLVQGKTYKEMKLIKIAE